MKWKKLFLLLLPFCIQATYADTDSDLAKKAQNPVEKMISIPFNDNWNYHFGPRKQMQYILDIKPVIPFSLNQSWNLITRTIIPMIRQPNIVTLHGKINSVGDVNPTFFISPNSNGIIRWGVGPTVILPTASNKQLGQGKYSIGPSAVLLAMPGHWVVGVPASNAWSVAGDTKRATVNQFTLQYFLNYNLAAGWYVTSSPIITADWTATAGDRWTVPVGAGVGRVLRIGSQPLNISLQAYDNVKTPNHGGADWQAQFNVSLLFPEA